jgi:hypothetical protein
MADGFNPMVEALRARMLLVQARKGDADAFDAYVKEMLTRGATRGEQSMLRNLLAGTEPTSRIAIATATRKRGRPGGPPAQLRTAHGILDRTIVGEAIFQQIIVQPPIDRAAISSALAWAESHFKIRRVMARALLRETVDRAFTILSTHLSKQISRACWLNLRAWLDSAEGRAAKPNADTLIAVGDSMFATIK